MRRSGKCIRLVTVLALMANLIGCTKRVAVPPAEYGEAVAGEDFVHVTTIDGKVYELQEVSITDTSVTGLLRHTKGDVRPVGAGGKEAQSAWIEIGLSDVQTLEVERINKRRVFLAFGIVAVGLAGAIVAVKATGGGGDDGGGGTPPVKP